MKKYLLGALALAFVALPAAASAATYAYVNNTGEVRTIDAASAQAALMAPDIDNHSGVMLIDANSSIVGTSVSGV